MATPNNPLHIPSTIDTFTLNTTLANYTKQLTDNVYNSNEILRLANQHKDLVNGGGSIVEHLIESEQDNGGFYLGSDLLNNTQTNSLTQVEYKWQNAYEPIQITRDEERDNSGDMTKILDLAGTKTRLSEKAIAKRLEQALSTPVGGSNNLIDFESLVNTGNQAGSINGTNDTFWQSTIVGSGAFATQGLTDMTTAYYLVSSGSVAENPTHFVTNQTIFQKFEQTRLPHERISNVSAANAGFENLSFKGRPLFYGNFISSGILFGLNMNYISLKVDSGTDMVTTEFITPTNQTTKVAYILWRGNLTTNNRRRHYKLTGIT